MGSPAPSPPSSQQAPAEAGSSSMYNAPKRTFSYMTREGDDDDGGPSQGSIPTTAMDEHLTCAICQEIMHNPFYVEPCGHSYCRECLGQWWMK